MEHHPEPWPLRHLVLHTPGLELRPDDDAGLLELVGEAYRGVHPPETMPFGFPWTDAPAEELGCNTLQHHWKLRAELTPGSWTLNFLVRRDGRVIGTQGLTAKNFAITREVHTGSWIGRRHQGQGYGTEMRAAALAFAFDHLDAEQARSDAFTDNPASRGVSRKLGYVEDGVQRQARRGESADVVRLLLTRERFDVYRPRWKPAVAGIEQCLPMLVAAQGRNRTGPRERGISPARGEGRT
ncbi:GNAT family N-acetyltransferase [Haloactinomyces albus]|uniref:RimJ/RimL family protein N-acetyltransferase n=1 Tax=Haloactinomyces albus TaxID=1352928 RepID=A0AAE4CLH4_9ACTN|nr:GNAT family N-acetyltransferase [Haloactinomyces albus]MDR7301839.1 RimJ/RimL family protein N-acetyltransferase [Haloactinomyces albus]